MNMKTEGIVVTEEQHDRRIDNFLFTLMKNVPKSRIYRAIRQGEVRVNSKRVKAEYRLQEGDQLRIPPISQPTQAPVAKPSNTLTDLLQQSILYEDEVCLVINKPALIAVHGGSGIQLGIIEALRVIYPKHAMELAHRLDRDTSGCLMVAKRPSAARELHRQLREGEVRKIYRALIKGHLPQQKVVVDKPLFKNQLQSGERIVKVDYEQGKPSLSIFREIKRFKECSLVEVELKTGRTHQIRVHAATLGNPVVGDSKYGDKLFNQQAKGFGVKRLFLHAAELTFMPPGKTQKITLQAAFDAELTGIIEKLSTK